MLGVCRKHCCWQGKVLGAGTHTEEEHLECAVGSSGRRIPLKTSMESGKLSIYPILLPLALCLGPSHIISLSFFFALPQFYYLYKKRLRKLPQ